MELNHNQQRTNNFEYYAEESFLQQQNMYQQSIQENAKTQHDHFEALCQKNLEVQAEIANKQVAHQTDAYFQPYESSLQAQQSTVDDLRSRWIAAQGQHNREITKLQTDSQIQVDKLA